jgi:hypothetical protein
MRQRNIAASLAKQRIDLGAPQADVFEGVIAQGE